MPDSLCRSRNRFSVHHLAGAELHPKAESAEQQLFQDFHLDLAHHLNKNPASLFLCADMEHRLLFLQNSDFLKRGHAVLLRTENHFAGENRLQEFFSPFLFRPITFSDPAVRKSGHRAHLTRPDFLHGAERGSGINSDLIDLFSFLFPSAAADRLLHPQGSPCDLEPCQSLSVFIPVDFKYPCPEPVRIFFFLCKLLQAGQQTVHAVHLQGRAEPDRNQLSLGRQFPYIPIRDRNPVQKPLHQHIVTDSHIFLNALRLQSVRYIRQIRSQRRLKFFKNFFPVGSRLIHLIDKDKCRNIVMFQQLPEISHLPGHSVRSTDHQNRFVQNLQSPLHLRRKIPVPRRVHQGKGKASCLKLRLFGKNGNAALSFQGIRIQKGVPMIHAAFFPDGPGQIQQTLGQGRLAGVYMSQQTQTDISAFHIPHNSHLSLLKKQPTGRPRITAICPWAS